MKNSRLVLLGCLFLIGCGESEPPQDPLDKVKGTISSFEGIEAQIQQIESTTRERDARERIYFHFYAERDAILEIAHGDYSPQSSLHRALTQEMAWVILGELLERRPDFQLRVERERDVPAVAEPIDPALKNLPRDFQ